MAGTGRRKRPLSTPHRSRPYAMGGSSPKTYPSERCPVLADNVTEMGVQRAKPSAGVWGKEAWEASRDRIILFSLAACGSESQRKERN